MKLKINQRRENTFLVLFLSVLSLTLITFLSSKLWMYDDDPLMQTPYHTNINGLDQTTLVLNKWEYNADKEFMEVTMKTKQTGNDAVRPKLSYTAKDRESKSEYQVDVVYEDNENVVVHIKNVPNKFKVIGLFVEETRDQKVLENEIKTSISELEGSLYQDGHEQNVKLPKPKVKIVVGDYRTIKQNDSLEKKSKHLYQVEFIEAEISRAMDAINKLQEEHIPYQEELKNHYAKEIKTLEADLEYQTSEEQVDTNAIIRVKEGNIERVNEQQEEYQMQVDSLKEKIMKLKTRLDNLLAQEKEVSDTGAEIEQDELENEDGEK